MDNEKRRREFEVRQNGIFLVATGILYDEGNVKISWREDIGYTEELYNSISQVFGIVPGANTIKIFDEEKNV